VKRGPKAPGFDPKRDLLFVGLGATPVAYYRCFLPAMALGCDWSGVAGEPPKTAWVTGLVGKESVMPNMLEDYKVVILQQPAGKGWNNAIENMREAGVKVIYEVDDYLHGIQHMGDDHDYSDKFDKEHLWNVEQAMKRCDAVIASTEWIRGNYSHFNRNAYVCRNGIDMGRYELTIPERETVNIGWAGGTGHTKAIVPWLAQTANLMRIRPHTTFVSIGQGFAQAFRQHFPPERALAVPFAALEQYPAAMTMLDIGLAPGGRGGWWRGKSDLRWLEAGALGIPLVANPRVYPDIEDGVTGMTAVSPGECFEKLLHLVDDREFRTTVGRQAQEVIRETRSIDVMKDRWIEVAQEVLEA
jgi:glycosyltransferase involved in cell wall biosynthesis